ncbi:MAG TPA: aldo/keto reductase, partial [Prolixibacteraceae bacterium]|nr:aldo/keto reductase [Prolixibacteraceae bacterium]
MAKLNMNRRKFISALSLGTAHLLLSNPLYASTGRVYSGNPLQKVKLGNSGIETTLLGVGTGVHAGNRTSYLTRQEKQKSLDTLLHAYDMGFRNFDCADTYGTHGMMSEVLPKMDREEITITSKIWVRGGGIPDDERPDANIVVDRFRKELKTDYIDLMQIHCMIEENWTETQK